MLIVDPRVLMSLQINEYEPHGVVLVCAGARYQRSFSGRHGALIRGSDDNVGAMGHLFVELTTTRHATCNESFLCPAPAVQGTHFQTGYFGINSKKPSFIAIGDLFTTFIGRCTYGNTDRSGDIILIGTSHRNVDLSGNIVIRYP